MSFTRKNVFAPLPKVQRAMPVVLGGDPKGVSFTYANGSNIIVRNLQNPLDAYAYSEHAAETTVAKFAPSGFYIASADVTGKVRIWDTTNAEHLLKYEYRPLSGAIRDLAWTEDSKRLVVCGEGSDTFAKAFLWDSGSTVGELSGHSKKVNSIDVKQTRPFRVATGSEDTDVGFYAGPPFKLQTLAHDHARFVNSVRFAPDGNLLLTGGADGKCLLYDGKEGTLAGELSAGAAGTPAHDSGVMAVAWHQGSKRALSASSDKTVKLWDIETKQCVTTFTFGEDLEWQQLGCLWQGETIVSASLNGFINYLDPAAPAAPTKSIQGHTKYVTSLAVDAAATHFYSGDYEGRVVRTEIATGTSTVLGAHGNAVAATLISSTGITTVGLDDAVRMMPVEGATLGAESCKLEAAPKAAAAGPDGSVVVVAAANKSLVVLLNGAAAATLNVAYDPLSVDVNVAGTHVAVGDSSKGVHIYTLAGTTLTHLADVEAAGAVEALKFSPDGRWLCTADAARNVFCFDCSTAAFERSVEFVKYHTAKITTVAWSADNDHVATGALDSNIMVWSVSDPLKKIKILGAHPQAGLTKLAWLDATTLISAGLDACVRTFAVTF